MQMTIDMPIVNKCTISECAYNMDSACHARAITVGDGTHPGCDTFFRNSAHTRARERTAGIGACKVTGCSSNDDFECMADGINVGMADGEPCCLSCSM